MAGVEAADKERQQVQATFSVFDADNSGAIDVGELEGLLKELCIPVKDKDELHAIMTELDGDGSGDIDFHEFYMWFKQVGESKKGGIIGNALSASLAVQKFGNAMAGATRMLEAKRVIIACAEHDAAQHARLLFRQSRPDEGHDGDAVAREVAVDLAAEKRFSAVRAVVGRPTQDGGGGGDNEVPEYEARSLRARRLLYHPDLWPVPPPPPKLVPPHWMNADRPGLSDPFDEAGDAVKLGAKIHGVDPTAGERAAPRASDGMRGMTRHHFLNGKPEKQAPGPGSTFARAIVALRKDIAFPDAARLRPETDAPGVEVVPEGAMKALATFAWRPDMEPRPRRNVSIEAEFTGWKPARLQPSRKRHGAYELEFALPPGRYRYGFRVDGEHHVDPLAPIARTGNGSYNVLHVLAYHRSKQNDALSPPKPKRGEPLEICLNGHRLKDDGAWALADAIRSGGGGGALRVLALQANGLSGDGVGSLCTALASGAALKLESLDLSKKKRCSPAMQKRRAPAIMAAVASVAAVVAYCVMPPRPFPDRLAFIPEEMTIIDNKFYDLPQWAAQWHTPDAALNTLGHMNSARVPYFDDAWRRELGGTNGSFLDVGCGGGLLTNALAARGYKLRGVDPSTNSLVAARQQAAEELPTAQRPEFLEGTCYALPAADGALDGVVMSDVLEHFHDLRAAVGEVYRVLRPGGVFVFDTINRSYFSWFVLIVLLEKIAGGIPAGTHDWRLFITPDEVEQLLNSTGFEVGPRTDLVGMRPEDPSDTSKGFVQDPSDVSATYLWWARKPL